VAQKSISKQTEIRDWLQELWKTNPPPQGWEFLVVMENSIFFKKGVAEPSPSFPDSLSPTVSTEVDDSDEEITEDEPKPKKKRKRAKRKTDEPVKDRPDSDDDVAEPVLRGPEEAIQDGLQGDTGISDR
jgi:hypothetical protein